MQLSSISSLSNIPGSDYQSLTASTQVDKAKTDSFQSALDSALASQDREKIMSSCVEFESYFIHMMFKEMRKTLQPENGILPPSRAEEYFQDMLDEENSNNIANTGNFGLADMMYQQLTMQLDSIVSEEA